MYEHRRWVMEWKFCDEITFKTPSRQWNISIPSNSIWLQPKIYITSIYFNILCLIRARLMREWICSVGWWWINKLHIISHFARAIELLLIHPHGCMQSEFLFAIEMKWGMKKFNFLRVNSLERLTNVKAVHFLIFIKMLSCSNVKLYSNQFSLPIALRATTVDDVHGWWWIGVKF